MRRAVVLQDSLPNNAGTDALMACFAVVRVGQRPPSPHVVGPLSERIGRARWSTLLHEAFKKVRESPRKRDMVSLATWCWPAGSHVGRRIDDPAVTAFRGATGQIGQDVAHRAFDSEPPVPCRAGGDRWFTKRRPKSRKVPLLFAAERANSIPRCARHARRRPWEHHDAGSSGRGSHDVRRAPAADRIATASPGEGWSATNRARSRWSVTKACRSTRRTPVVDDCLWPSRLASSIQRWAKPWASDRVDLRTLGIASGSSMQWAGSTQQAKVCRSFNAT